jgi:hypothetical protein
MARKWFIKCQQVQKGPLSAEAVLALLEAGEAPRDSEVWTKGMKSWKPIPETHLKKIIEYLPPEEGYIKRESEGDFFDNIFESPILRFIYFFVIITPIILIGGIVTDRFNLSIDVIRNFILPAFVILTLVKCISSFFEYRRFGSKRTHQNPE